MPLSPPVERTCLHNRTYDFQGYQRADGLWDIEGRIVDTKTYPFAKQDRGEIPPGEALHDLSIRLTHDGDFTWPDIEAVTEHRWEERRGGKAGVSTDRYRWCDTS